MTTLDFTKLGKVLALAGSDQDGEALAALRKAGGMLKAAGMSFTDVAEKLKAPAVQNGHTFWPPPQQPKPKPKGYTVGGTTWESKAAYDRYCADAKARREAERARYAPQRAVVLAKYGSVEAAIARDPREQALHDAAAPWLEGPHVPDAPYEYLAGRWHDRMGKWARHDFSKHPVAECRAAIEAALPMPGTVREARDELHYWDDRDHEICHALECWGDEQLDLPAAYRRSLVIKLYRDELPVVSLDDLHIRLQFAAHADWKDDACVVAPSNLDGFERLVLNAGTAPAYPSNLDTVQIEQPRTAAGRRQAVLDLLIHPTNTATLSDREIARRVGVAPSTVGALRRKLDLSRHENSIPGMPSA
ncbi:MAG: DUF2786 domain-containing protein [Rhodospirillaceae bacterium]